MEAAISIPADQRTPASALLAAAMTELSQLLLDTESFQELMVQLAQLSARTVPGVKTCGITMAKDGRVVTVGAANTRLAVIAQQLVDSYSRAA